MWNRSKKFLALLVCINFVQFGAIALALEADEDQGAATGGSTERSGGEYGREKAKEHWRKPTPKPSATPMPTVSPTPSATPMPTASPTPKPSPSPMPSASPTPSPTPMPTASPTPMPSPTPTPAKTWSMYNQYCAGCHGTSKQGSSATSIQNAINNISAMSSLKFLTSAQITAIAAGQ